jgi:hypothetical protein
MKDKEYKFQSLWCQIVKEEHYKEMYANWNLLALHIVICVARGGGGG